MHSANTPKTNHVENYGIDHEQAERLYAEQYQNIGVSLLILTFIIVTFGYGSFWLSGYIGENLPPYGGVQSIRLVAITACVALIALIRANRGFFVRNYAIVSTVTYVLLTQITAYIAYRARLGNSPLEIYWAITSSISITSVVVFGCARLSMKITLAIVFASIASALLYALKVPSTDQQPIIRIVVHLSIATFIGYFLKSAFEKRERSLFFIGQENRLS